MHRIARVSVKGGAADRGAGFFLGLYFELFIQVAGSGLKSLLRG